MSTGLWILIAVLAFIGGVVAGFFIARKSMVKYFEQNPPIDEDMLRMMMAQMGQKPSEAKLRQIAATMKAQSAKRNKK